MINGAPQHPWVLDCPPCEDFLRKHNSDQWATTTSEIPETYDEKLAREDFEKRGARDKDALMTLIMAKSVGIDPSLLPASLTRMISDTPLQVPLSGVMVCPAGHENAAGQKFCGECGSPMSSPAAKAALEAPERSQEPAAAEPSPEDRQRSTRLRDARLDELQALARLHGLAEDGKRPDLISRLAAAGVTNADLQRLPVAA